MEIEACCNRASLALAVPVAPWRWPPARRKRACVRSHPASADGDGSRMRDHRPVAGSQRLRAGHALPRGHAAPAGRRRPALSCAVSRQVRRFHRAQDRRCRRPIPGPWFQPSLLEQAATGVPRDRGRGCASIRAIPIERLAYALALRNYALSSAVVRGTHAATDRRRRLSGPGRRRCDATRSATRSGIRRRACSMAPPTRPARARPRTA